MGFLIPGALTGAALAHMIAPRPGAAILSGAGLSAGLHLLFRHALGLLLPALPPGLF